MTRQRIHKILARAGCASRRKAEELILSGRVTVNGEVVSEVGASADPEYDIVCLDGRPVKPPGDRVVVMLNKPRGVLTTMYDPQGRPTVADLVRDIDRRLFPVGRLDADSEGLLLMTDDGDLALRVHHPRFGVVKTYEVYVEGFRHGRQLDRLRRGVVVEEGRVLPQAVELLSRSRSRAWIRIRISEGKKRMVRRMCAEVRLQVLRLRRVAVGGLHLGSLRPGAYRVLGPSDIRRLLSDPASFPAPPRRVRR